MPDKRAVLTASRFCCLLAVRSSAESDAGTGRCGPGYGSGGMGGYIHDEVGVEGHADPFQQRDGGDHAACF